MLRMDGDDQVEIRMDGNITWMEVTDRFVQFLQGCGYQVTDQDIVDYLYTEPCQPSEINVSVFDEPNKTYSFEPLTTAMKNWNNQL